LAEELQAENLRMQAELERWRTATPYQQADQLEEELRRTLAELARLQQQLSQVDQKYLEAARQVDGEHLEVVLSIAQELRQPMSSITGYTDLLLGESVGILGALQRKFLERIKASTERMGALIEDLIRVSTLEQESTALQPVEVDLNEVIDEAITHTSARMIEKNIALRVDLPDNLPHIQADQDAVQQVVINLLQNAGAASPPNGEIVLSVQKAENEGASLDYVLLQITDSGGGIPEDDLPRVFSRLYRADNPLIQGVGDTGVGLSVAKNLVEALNGRIWVDTVMGKGSTFCVLLPVAENNNPATGWGI
jgi:signal transduction histidine kinase